MKKLLALPALLLALLASSAASAQTAIDLKDIASHVGDSVRVCGNVAGGRFFARDSLTLLNVGGTYPNQLLTILIRPEARTAIGGAPETDLRDKTVCVTGKVIMFKDKPEIIVYTREQLAPSK